MAERRRLPRRDPTSTAGDPADTEGQTDLPIRPEAFPPPETLPRQDAPTRGPRLVPNGSGNFGASTQDRLQELAARPLPMNGRVLLDGQIRGVRHWEREQVSGWLMVFNPLMARQRQQMTDFYVELPGGQTCSVRCEGEISGFLAETNLVRVRGLMRNGAITALAVFNLSTTPPSLIYQKPACFIATAACGSPGAVEVETLVQFREQVLRPRVAGRWLIAGYEAISPALARWIARRTWRRAAALRLAVRPACRLVRFVGRRPPT